MSLIQPPHITKVRPNGQPMRDALRRAGNILAGSGMGMYSWHDHFDIRPGWRTFEYWIAPEELMLYPLPEEEAARRGSPSSWRIENGRIVTRRYTDRRLHERSGVDVASASFLTQLARSSEAFAERGLFEFLEINIANRLFPPGEGRITCEETDETRRIQRVTIIETPQEILNGNWAAAACWTPNAAGELFVTGWCMRGSSSVAHEDPEGGSSDEEKEE